MHPVIIKIAEPGALVASGVQYFCRIKHGLDQISSLPGLLREDGDRGGGGGILRDTPKDVGQSVSELLGIVGIVGVAIDRGIAMNCHLIEVSPGCIRESHTQDKSLDAVGVGACGESLRESPEGVEPGIDGRDESGCVSLVSIFVDIRQAVGQIDDVVPLALIQNRAGLDVVPLK